MHILVFYDLAFNISPYSKSYFKEIWHSDRGVFGVIECTILDNRNYMIMLNIKIP